MSDQRGPMMAKLNAFMSKQGPAYSSSVEEMIRAGSIDSTLRERGFDPLTWPWDTGSEPGISEFREWWAQRPINDLEDWRLVLGEIEAMAKTWIPGASHGPSPMVTASEVDRARETLIAQGRHSGERSIARLLGVSRDAVRYAEGKDRR